jgi:hypothetical protein
VNPKSVPLTRAAILPALVAILFVATGCSVTFGTTPNSPASSTAASAAASGASGSGAASPDASDSGAEALCTDLSTEDQLDMSDIQASLTYWEKVVADSPAGIVDQAQAVEDGFNKIADGMSADDQENNNAINNAIEALETWDVDNCPG